MRAVLPNAYVMEVVESTLDRSEPCWSRSFVRFSSIEVVSMNRSCVLTYESAVRDFSGYNFVDASIVGCV
jgi:hypothetical protein